MSNPFTRSNLQYSLLNIADDVHKSLGKGLSYIKNAITGQPIDVERKFEKNISIRPRAKWFLSANELPKAETLLGLERRLIFIRIVGKFGVGKDAKQANLNMADELKEELSGIFNNAYEIYKQMIASGEKIAPCVDQYSLMSEFKEKNDEVLQFMEDNINNFIIQPTLRRQAPEKIHENYLTWAKNLNRRELMTKKQLSTELNRLIKKGDIKGVTKKHFENGDFYLFEEVKNLVQPDETPTQVQEVKQAQQEISFETDKVPVEKQSEQAKTVEKAKIPEHTEENVKAFFKRERFPDLPFEAKKQAERQGETFRPVEDTLEYLENCINKPINKGEGREKLVKVRDKFKGLFDVA